MIEGFGISTSWKGNAVASSDPKNFYSLWHEYQHALLSSFKSQNLTVFENGGSYLESILAGAAQKSDREVIDEEISSGCLETNEVINNSFSQIIKSNSALHLIGNLSGNDGEFGNINHLLSLLKLAKQKNIFRVYIHLILDASNSRSFDQVSSDILNLNKQIEIIGVGEIASLCGMKYIEDWNGSRLAFLNFLKAKRAILEGRGNIYLSAEQAIAQNRSRISTPDRVPPSVISFKSHPVGIVHDLDSVIFFNHNNTKFTNLIASFCGSAAEKNTISTPKFLNITTLLEYSLPGNKQVNIAIKKKGLNALPQILSSQNIKQIYLSDSYRALEVKSLLEGSGADNYEPDQFFIPALNLPEYCKNPKPVILETFKLAANSLSKDYNFIFVDFPSIDVITNNGNFNQAINAAKIIDFYLPVLVKKVLEANGKLIITSNYGNAEKMVHRSEYELLNRRTGNPVPFILISNESKNTAPKTSLENELIYDIIRKKNNLLDIAPTILGLMNLPIPNEMTGKCLIDTNKTI